MAYPNYSSPREVRAFMHAAYERYAQGIDVFPQARVTSDIDALPRKTRQIASILLNAWRTIDVDEEYFREQTELTCDRLAEADKDGAGVVVSKIGINAVRFSQVSLENGAISIQRGLFNGQDKDRFIKSLQIPMTDGTKTSLAKAA